MFSKIFVALVFFASSAAYSASIAVETNYPSHTESLTNCGSSNCVIYDAYFKDIPDLITVDLEYSPSITTPLLLTLSARAIGVTPFYEKEFGAYEVDFTLYDQGGSVFGRPGGLFYPLNTYPTFTKLMYANAGNNIRVKLNLTYMPGTVFQTMGRDPGEAFVRIEVMPTIPEPAAIIMFVPALGLVYLLARRQIKSRAKVASNF